MTTENDQDLALTALLAAASDVEAGLPVNFIKASYAIQRLHQFNQDQTISLHDLEKLVEDYLDQGEAK
jgi:hypothetical protein